MLHKKKLRRKQQVTLETRFLTCRISESNVLAIQGFRLFRYIPDLQKLSINIGRTYDNAHFFLAIPHELIMQPLKH